MSIEQQICNNASRRHEDAWRIINNFRKYRPEDIEEAAKFLQDSASNFLKVSDSGAPMADLEILQTIFMGLYHYNPRPLTASMNDE